MLASQLSDWVTIKIFSNNTTHQNVSLCMITLWE